MKFIQIDILMTNSNDNISQLRKYITQRFNQSGFNVSTFKNIEEVDTKILCNDDIIIVLDEYDETTDDYDITFRDQFIIKKREGKEHIYYCDVIDELIKNEFNRS